jgi:hypothetical protein
VKGTAFFVENLDLETLYPVEKLTCPTSSNEFGEFLQIFAKSEGKYSGRGQITHTQI